MADATELGALLRARNRNEWVQFAARTYQLDYMTGVLSDGLYLIHRDLTYLADQMANQNSLLAGIEDALRNPSAVAAAERTRRGVRAVNSGWWREARIELDAALKHDQFNVTALVARGIAKAKMANLRKAAPDWELASRYGADTGLGASAALLAMAAYAEFDGDAHLRVARLAEKDYGTCSEVLLAASLPTGDSALTRRAVSFDPAAAFVAVAVNAPGAEEAALRCATMPNQVASLLDLTPMMAEVVNLVSRPPGVAMPILESALGSHDPAERLASAAVVLPTFAKWVPRAKQLAYEAWHDRMSPEVELMSMRYPTGYGYPPGWHRAWRNAEQFRRNRSQMSGENLGRLWADLNLLSKALDRIRPTGF